jgi:hypothetical protein
VRADVAIRDTPGHSSHSIMEANQLAAGSSAPGLMKPCVRPQGPSRAHDRIAPRSSETPARMPMMAPNPSSMRDGSRVKVRFLAVTAE